MRIKGIEIMNLLMVAFSSVVIAYFAFPVFIFLYLPIVLIIIIWSILRTRKRKAKVVPPSEAP